MNSEEDIITLRTNEPNKNHLWQDGSVLNYYRVENKGKYSVLVHDVCYRDGDTTEVRLAERPFNGFWIDTTICAPIKLNVKLTGVDSFGVNDVVYQQDVHQIKAPGYYQFKSYFKGCQFLDSVRVIDDCGIFIPNAFTPGENDNLNPHFTAYGENIEYYNMRIFNRWGQLIFQTTDLNNGWDGSFEGAQSPNGVYIYVISYNNFGSALKTVAGNITLIR